jgi:tetratricopeptide (TPR) repeat protein
MKNRKLLLLLPLAVLFASCSQDPHAQAQRYVNNGNKFFEKAKYKEATIMYRRALQKDLKFGEAYYRLGLAELQLRAFGDAVRALRRAIELQPKNSDATTKLAEIYLLAGVQDPQHAKDLLAESRELVEKLLQANPDSYDGHRMMGQLALVDKDYPTAVSELSTAYKLQNKRDLTMPLFQALFLSGRPADAEKLGRDVIASEKTFGPMYDALYALYMRTNRISDAEQVLRQKVDNNPTKANYVLQLVAHYYAAKRFDQMDAAMQQLADEKRFPEGHLLAGDFFLFRAHEFDRARVQYEAGEKSQPKDKLLYQKRLVELLATSGQSQDAGRLLETILATNPKDNEAIAMHAALLLQTGNAQQIKQASNDLQSLVTKTPDNHLLRFNLARALLAQGEIEPARLQLEAAIKLRPDFIIARELLAKIYLGKNDAGRALKEADDILAMNANNLQAHLTRSSALIGLGEQNKAHEELDVIKKIAPDNRDARYQVGFVAWKAKDYKQAEQVFGELYKTNPKDVRGLLGVVESLSSQGRLPEAIKVVEDASAREPDRRDLKMALANLYARDMRYDDSIRIFSALLQADPKSAELLSRLGEAQRRKGDVNGAIETFRRASQAAPTDTKPLLELGLLMDGTGRRDQAKPIYEQILKIQPDHPIALNNLAYIKAEEGVDLDSAITMVQRALQKAPTSTNIKDTLGWIYIKKNLSDDAVRVFKDLVTAEPNNPAFHYHYGMALLQKGDRPAAKRELEIAIQDKPSKDDATKIRELLAANR